MIFDCRKGIEIIRKNCCSERYFNTNHGRLGRKIYLTFFALNSDFVIKRQLGLVLVLNGIHRYPGCHFNQVAAVKDAGYSFYEETDIYCMSVKAILSLLFKRDTKRQFCRMSSDPEETD